MTRPLQVPDVLFLSGVRTGFGAFGGALKDISATELGVIAARAALDRSGAPADAVGHVIFGNVDRAARRLPERAGAERKLITRPGLLGDAQPGDGLLDIILVTPEQRDELLA